MAFTVTATQSGSSSNRGVYLKVLVLTNAVEAGGATSGGTNAVGVAASGSLTPNFSGSFVAFSVAEDGVPGGLSAAAANNTYDYSNADATDSWSSAQGHYTGTVTASSALTYGEGTFSSGDHSNWCAYEVPASGGTWAIDGSSPAGVNTTSGTAIATASFTPPAGSVLVAMVTAGGSGSGTGITVTMTDTSGLGMAWTRRAISGTADSFQPCYVFTATVPAVTISSAAFSASPGRTWQRRFHHIQRPPFPSYVAPPPLVNGQQPHGFGSSRRPWSAIWGGVASPPLPSPPGTAPVHLVVARRAAARAVWRGFIASTVNASAGQSPAGTPPAHLVIARRAAARAVWHGTVSSTTNLLNGNQPGGLVRRRAAARAVWGGQSTPQPHVPGAVQPRAAVPVPRRTATRALWRGPAAVTTTNLTVPAGSVQPRATVPVPRRSAARAVQRSALGLLNAHGPGGTLQPRATVPVPRRYPSRAVWRGITSAAFPNGSVQPWPTIPVPRGKAARAVTASVLGLANAHGPAGTVQPRAAVPVPRRAAARILRASVLGPANAHGPGGAVQPWPTRQPRRTAARAVAHWTPVTTVNGSASPPVSGTVQPAATAPHRPHAPQRVVWRDSAVPGTQPQPATGGRVARRSAARAVIHAGPAPFPPPSGTVQAEATVPARRRPQARVVWRGSAVPGTRPQPATGGLVRRRAAAHGLWHGGAGAPPPATTPGTPASGKSVTTRRPPNRGQWHGTLVRGANALPVAVPAPRQRLTVPRRTAARAYWAGTVARTANTPLAIRFSVPYARQLWSVADARQLWSVSDARQLWPAPDARNSS